MMARVKSRGTAPEMLFRRALRKAGIRFRSNDTKLPGKPDIVIPTRRLAVFVDGDFWHGNPKKFRIPKSNCEYWQQKILGNRTRDRAVTKRLKQLGWRVFRVWESSLKDEETIIAKLKLLL